MKNSFCRIIKKYSSWPIW